MQDPEDTTQLLAAAGAGDRDAAERLLPMVYDELRAIAGAYFRRQPADHTLQPTALVHEAYIRLLGESGGNWESRAHFFAVAAKAMRNLLVNHAEARNALKRGGGVARVPLHEDAAAAKPREVDPVALDEVLKRLEALDPRKARVIELRYFGGLTAEEAAHVLGVSLSTVEADTRMAKAWLFSELGGT